MSLLRRLREPADLRRLDPGETAELAAEIRRFLVATVARTGGHLGPNLGVVELTIALHRVFDSPHDTLIWDTGHQAYVHKLLTGRVDGWERLKKAGRPVGLPQPGREPRTTTSRTATRPRRCPGRTGWPGRTR